MSTIILCGLCFLCGIIFLLLLLGYQKKSRIYNSKKYYNDRSYGKCYITGDKHRNFQTVELFCKEVKTCKSDILIVLGDAGINYYEDYRDYELKTKLSRLNITLLCIHGNKEKRPQDIPSYGIKNLCGGKVYYEPQYPNICFAIDGEIYTLENRQYIVCGGAHSIDKIICLEKHKPFWDNEIPDEKIKAQFENQLKCSNNKIYGIFTHTCPLKYLPKEMFVSVKQNIKQKTRHKKKNRKRCTQKPFQPDIDRTTESWLDSIEENIDYSIWFCGHYHVDKNIDKIVMMYNEIRPLHI